MDRFLPREGAMVGHLRTTEGERPIHLHQLPSSFVANHAGYLAWRGSVLVVHRLGLRAHAKEVAERSPHSSALPSRQKARRTAIR